MTTHPLSLETLFFHEAWIYRLATSSNLHGKPLTPDEHDLKVSARNERETLRDSILYREAYLDAVERCLGKSRVECHS